MISKSYLNSAHQAIRDSYKANERGEYLSAWGKTVPARLNYLADAIINAAAIPLHAVGVLHGLAEAILTWGRSTSRLQRSLKGMDNSLSRVFFGSLGAIASPAVSRAFEVDSAVELAFTAALVTAVAAGIIFLASKIRLPNLVFYNSQTGFIWGWQG